MGVTGCVTVTVGDATGEGVGDGRLGAGGAEGGLVGTAEGETVTAGTVTLGTGVAVKEGFGVSVAMVVAVRGGVNVGTGVAWAV